MTVLVLTKERKLRILIISQYWSPENNVPQRRWEWLASILKSQGHEIRVVAPPPASDRRISFIYWLRASLFRPRVEEETGSAVDLVIRSGFIPCGGSLVQRAMGQAGIALGSLYAVIKEFGIRQAWKPDLVIGTIPALPTAVVAFVAAKISSAKLAIDLRDAWPDLLAYSSEWNKGVKSASLKHKILSRGPIQFVSFVVSRSLYFVLGEADGVMFTADDLKFDFQNRPQLRKNPKIFKNMVTIRNVFPRGSSNRKSRPSSGEKSLKVLYAGTIGRAQRLQNVIDAAEIAGRRGVSVDLKFVGSGDARLSVRDYAKRRKVSATFIKRKSVDSISDYYDWADTALVHLTDWKPLERTVPSKLFELMEYGVPITGVVAGESVKLIESLDAGYTVPPESPEALADLWCAMAKGELSLKTSQRARLWVDNERNYVVPGLIENFLKQMEL